MNRRRVDAAARPRRGLNGEQVDREILGDWEPFLGDPIEIGIDPVTRFRLWGRVGVGGGADKAL